MSLTVQQTAVKTFVQRGRGNAIVRARAGTGKTHTLLECMSDMRGEVAYTSYNNANVKEAKVKVAARGLRHVTCGTFHSFGFNAWRAAHKNVKVEGRDRDGAGYKKFDRIAEELTFPKHLLAFISKAMDLAKQRAFGLLNPLNDPQAWLDLVSHFDLDGELSDETIKSFGGGDKDFLVKQGLRYACKGLKLSYNLGSEVIDYSDMLWLPLVGNVRLRPFDWLLVDEAQDTNPARRCLARAMVRPGGRAIFVGDECQPLGTKVSVPGGGTVNIEDLKVGDMVVSYRPSDVAFAMKGKRVTGITRRPFVGDLIVARAPDGKTSRYTPNHHCYANFKPLRNKFAVYMMRKGDQFRIGKCKMEYNATSGVSARMHHEAADAAWILEVHDTAEEAFFREQAIAGRFGLPQLMFSAKNMMRGPAADYLPRAWGFIGSNHDRGVECLSYFGRDVWHPLFQRGTGKQQTVKRPVVVHAANLMNGVLMLPFNGTGYNHAKAKDWVPVEISREWHEGDVVSLTVEDTHLYVADGLLTHNCQAIYGFTGADNDSLDQITRDFGASVLPLTVTFRCPKKVVEEAKVFVPDYEAAAEAPEGEVLKMDESGFWDQAKTLTLEDAIICRKTKPLVETCFGLIRRNIRAHVEGKDIGRGLLSLMARWREINTIPELLDNLSAFRDTETQKLMAAGKEAKAEQLNDQIDTLEVIANSLPADATLADVRAKIEDLFTDTKDGEKPKGVRLMTAHRSKGLEFPRVFLWGRNAYMPSPYARQDWQRQQERNLEYVALTRAMQTLVDVMVIPQ